VHRVEQERASLLAALPPARRTDADVVELRWMLEELRVSLFAQQLGTPAPISEKRIYRAMDAADS
jgi:ATP-dependent helicase HrpA